MHNIIRTLVGSNKLMYISTEASFLEYWPSSIAAAAILCVANELPCLSSVANPYESPETWCDGLSKVGLVLLYFHQPFVLIGYGE